MSTAALVKGYVNDTSSLGRDVTSYGHGHGYRAAGGRVPFTSKPETSTGSDQSYYGRGWRSRIAVVLSFSLLVLPVGVQNVISFGRLSSISSVDTGGIGTNVSMDRNMTRVGNHSTDTGANVTGSPSQRTASTSFTGKHRYHHQHHHQQYHSNEPPIWYNLSNYNLSHSTEMNYKMDVKGGFHGCYTQLRSTLDYTYHSNYIPQRQHLQDSIINILLNTNAAAAHNYHHNHDHNDNNSRNELKDYATTHHLSPQQHTNSPPPPHKPTIPWIVFTAGAMGAGKSYTIRHLSTTQPQRFPLQRFVTVDPDEIRRLLPEFDAYLDRTAEGSRPEMAGERTRKEAGMLAEILTQVALGQGRNVMVDGSLKDSDWYRRYFGRLRREYGKGLRIGILHVTAPRDAIFERARIRSQTTGRIVPQHTLVETIEKVPDSVRVLAPLVDFFAELHNAPNATDVKLVTEGMTWDSFRQVFTDSVAGSSNNGQISRHSTTPLATYPLPSITTAAATTCPRDTVHIMDDESSDNVFIGDEYGFMNMDAAGVFGGELLAHRRQMCPGLSRL